MSSQTLPTQSRFLSRRLPPVRTSPVSDNVRLRFGLYGSHFVDYHSMFYRLLSWKNPRATGISFAAAVLFIFAARYLNVIRYIFKLTWIVLGTTAAAEVAGQLALGKGLTSQFRPRQYFTIPKASLERLLDDVEQLINFFVIESQRIVFAENVYVTVAAFFASLISYFLIKVSNSVRFDTSADNMPSLFPCGALLSLLPLLPTSARLSTSRTRRQLTPSLRRAGTLPASRLPRSGTLLASKPPTLPRPSRVLPSNTQPRLRRLSTSTVDALPPLRSRRRTSPLPPRPTSRASPTARSLQSTRMSLLWFPRPLCKHLCLEQSTCSSFLLSNGL